MCSMQPLQDRVVQIPVIRGIVWVARVSRDALRNGVPAQGQAHHVDTQPLQNLDSLGRRLGAVQQPRVILDAVLNMGRRAGTDRREQGQQHDAGYRGELESALSYPLAGRGSRSRRLSPGTFGGG